MKFPIVFQSLDRIEGKEGRSKLLHSNSKLYLLLKKLKAAIGENYAVGADRMDLHIEVTKLRRDPDFREKAESIHEQMIDLTIADNWVYMGRAFVLNTPEVSDYGKTHITIAFFGRHLRPAIEDLRDIVRAVIEGKQE